MQLRVRALFVLGALAATSLPAARADVEGSSRVTFFREPSRSNSGLSVVHPQADVGASLGAFQIAAGHEIDFVSGATPRLYGPHDGPDAVTGATQFHDQRHAAHASLGWSTTTVGLTAAYSYGWENDYKSHTVTALARGDFLDRNFTLGLAYTRNFDSVCDAANLGAIDAIDRKPLGTSDRCFQSNQIETTTRRLDIHTFEPSLVWTATPRLLLQGGVTLQILDGFQSNPYRAVLIGSQGRAPQEHLPDLRQRYATFLRANYALPAIRSSVALLGRAYRDTWDLRAVTGEVLLQKYLATSVLVSLRGRYHVQSAASFALTGREYVQNGPPGAYWTGDRELGAMRTILGGLKLAYLRTREQRPDAFFDEVEVSVKAEGLFYSVDPDAPNSDRNAGLLFQAGLSARF